MQRIRRAHEDVGQQIASGLAKVFNAYCDQRGIASQHDDHVYPLKFWAMTVR
jgi:hypothetical protein